LKAAIVVGGGIGGIGAAIRLAVKGYKVKLLEANSYLGGKLSSFWQSGYRFDAGPSLFTMPELVTELFTLANRKPTDYFEYQRLPVICNYFWDDGTFLQTFDDIHRTAAEIESKTQEPAANVLKFIQNSRRIHQITSNIFLHQSLHRLRTYFSFRTLWAALRIGQIDAFRTMHQANSCFFKDKRIIQLFNRYATYNGSNPFRAPATLNVIPFLEFGQGAFFPTGGMYQIVSSLARLAVELGVEIVYNTRVHKIEVIKNRVVGVETDQGMQQANLVFSNADVTATYRKLLPSHPAPEKLLKQEKSTSGLIFYWGIKQQFPNLDLHNIFFSNDYEKEFKEMFELGTVASEPTIYINISSKYAPNDAPAGCENWFVMINSPPDQGQNWEVLIDSARKNIIQRLNKRLNINLESLIECESVLNPQLIELKTSSDKGALYGFSSNSRWAAFLRHPNFSFRIKGLYFVGGSVHPGGGIPLALLSAKIATAYI
jgi:phytoene desaturase